MIKNKMTNEISKTIKSGEHESESDSMCRSYPPGPRNAPQFSKRGIIVKASPCQQGHVNTRKKHVDMRTQLADKQLGHKPDSRFYHINIYMLL
jgi:hypothetical protein